MPEVSAFKRALDLAHEQLRDLQAKRKALEEEMVGLQAEMRQLQRVINALERQLGEKETRWEARVPGR